MEDQTTKEKEQDKETMNKNDKDNHVYFKDQFLFILEFIFG